MYSFLNDFSELAHPSILEAMIKANITPEEGYYCDSHSNHARELIKEAIGGKPGAEVHFITGGTLVNVITITSTLRPYQAVIAPNTGHISIHETGSIEAGCHKVIEVPSEDGKITPQQVQAVLDVHDMEHMVMPAMVYISNATEIGSVYTKVELVALSDFCKQNKLYLYCDGARLGSALMSRYSDLTLKDMADYTDAFYIGGTKNGALVGEALVIINPDLMKDFRYMKKQRGGLLAKGTVIGIQFEELFQNNLFYDLAKHENQMAEMIVDAMKEKGYSFLTEPQSNQIFPILPLDKIAELEADFKFMRWEKVDDTHFAIRIVTSWATSEAAVKALIGKL